MTSQSENAPSTRAMVPPTTLGGYLKGMGPGIVVVLSWLGTGDFISSAVSGSTYGYALLWTLLLAVLSRYFIVSAMSRYQLANQVGDETILDGYGRVWKGFPVFIGITTCILGFVYTSFLLSAAGTALNHLFEGIISLGSWGKPVWAVVVIAVALVLASMKGRHYRGLEILAQLTMATLVICFLIAIIGSGVHVGEMFKGLAFSLPEGGNGYITAVTVAVGLIGAVGGSAANLLYPYLFHEKGWRGKEFLRLQRYDLRSGTFVMFGLVLAVWVVAAETLNGTGVAVDSEAGLVTMMERAVGPAGPTIMWLAIFFVVFDNIVTQPRVFVRIFIESLYKTRPQRLARVRAAAPDPDVPEKDAFRYDRLFWIILVVIMTVPLIFSLPFAPDLVVLTLIGNGISMFTVPALMVGLLILTSSRKLLGAYRNKWWESLILLGISGIGFWATYELIAEFTGG